MNKKFLVIICFAILAIISISTIQAASAEKVTIDGFDFNIPDGYEEDSVFEIDDRVNQYGTTINAKGYVNGDKVVRIGVETPKGNVSDLLSNKIEGTETTINGVDGYLTSEVILCYWDDPVIDFSYIKDNNLISITVSDTDLLEEVII